MRAIIRSDIEIQKGPFYRLMESLRLLPSLDPDDQELIKQKEEILNSIALDDVQMVTRTYWFMIYHHDSRSWGLVNSPLNGIIEIRFRNRESSRLKHACEYLVHELLEHEKDSQSETKAFKISFPEPIMVLEAGSQHLAFFGDVLSLDIGKDALMERRNEWLVGWIAMGAGLALAFITIPPIEKLAGPIWGSDWTTWFVGTSGRLATSAFTTAAVAFLNVLLYYFDLKRQGAIRWRLK